MKQCKCDAFFTTFFQWAGVDPNTISPLSRNAAGRLTGLTIHQGIPRIASCICIRRSQDKRISGTHSVDQSTRTDNLAEPLTDNKLQTLVDRIRNGETDAANELFEYGRAFLCDTTSEAIENGLRSKMGSSDIVQQSLLEAYDQLKSFRGSTVAQFRSWLQTLARHNLIDADRQFRQAKRRDVSREIPLQSTSPLVGPDRTASSYHREIEADRELWNAVKRLPNHDQKLIELRHRHKMSHAEIADHMQISEVAVRKKLSRTIQMLRESLSRKPANPYDQPTE